MQFSSNCQIIPACIWKSNTLEPAQATRKKCTPQYNCTHHHKAIGNLLQQHQSVTVCQLVNTLLLWQGLMLISHTGTLLGVIPHAVHVHTTLCSWHPSHSLTLVLKAKTILPVCLLCVWYHVSCGYNCSRIDVQCSCMRLTFIPAWPSYYSLQWF